MPFKFPDEVDPVSSSSSSSSLSSVDQLAVGGPAPQPDPSSSIPLVTSEFPPASAEPANVSDPVPDAVARISAAISPKFAEDLLAKREPVTPDRTDLARVLLHLAVEHARSTKQDVALAKLTAL